MTGKSKAPVATEALQINSSIPDFIKNNEEKQIIKVTNDEFITTLFEKNAPSPSHIAFQSIAPAHSVAIRGGNYDFER